MTNSPVETVRAVWLNGAIVAAADASVSVFDHGYTVGDGVFETLKVIDGQPFAPTRHIERLERSATGLGLDLPVSHEKLRIAMDEVIAAVGPEAGRIRITLSGGPAPLGSGRGVEGPTLVVIAATVSPMEPDTIAVTVPWPRNERSAVAGLKTTSYAENVVALSEAAKVGGTEAIVANLAGKLCEGTGSNVFVVLDGRVLTPSLLSGCLAGVTRALVLEELPGADEEDMPIERLTEASEVILTSSVREVQALRALDGRPLPGASGPVAQAAAAALEALQARTLDP
jgi:branched-chain amino acid aminotransferase